MLFCYSRNHKFDFSIKTFKWLLKISLSLNINSHTSERNIKKNVTIISYKIIDDLLYFDDDK